MSQTSKTEYRPDIDGLRAIAVASVLLFHAFPAKLPGGYIGVDIFFVISGFLISRLIFESLQQQRFSYVQFYVRRVRRIFPALLLVLTATLAGGVWLLLPREYLELGRQTVAGVGFLANFLFYSETGYFDAAHQLKPLLHLWSLGIEEQFYITWPLLLAFLYPRTRRLPWIICGLMVLSFGWNIFSIGQDPSATFYLPMSRYWELMIGAVIAYFAVFPNSAPNSGDASPAKLGATGANVVALIGLLLICVPLVSYNEKLPFPGWRALPPTVGACCLIVASNSWLNRKWLANRVMVFIGLISYPLYLWHWVLLCGLEHKFVWEAPRSYRAATLLLSVLLAWLTYVCVEKPVRLGRHGVPVRAPALVALAILVASGGVFVMVTGGAAYRYPADVRRLATFTYDAKRDYREGTCQLSGEHPFSELGAQCIDSGASGSRLLVLWGDSHASSLYQGLRAIQAQAPGLRIAQFTASGCPPLLGVRLGKRKSCLEFGQDAFDRIVQLQPETVVIESWWDNYGNTPESEAIEMAALRTTVMRLAQAHVPHVVVVGDLPLWVIWQPDAQVELWRKTGQLPERTYSYFMPISARFDALVEQAIAGTPTVFISPIKSLCNVQGCLLNANDEHHTPITWDGAHLTDAGSRLFVGMNMAQFLNQPALALAH